MSGSRELFLKKGVTLAALYVERKQPDIIDLLTILVMDGKMMSIFPLSREIGIGSKLQDLGNDVLMIFRTSSSSIIPNSKVIVQWAVGLTRIYEALTNSIDLFLQKNQRKHALSFSAN